MNKRGWMNGHFAQPGWRSSPAQPLPPGSYSHRPPRYGYAVPPQQRDYQPAMPPHRPPEPVFPPGYRVPPATDQPLHAGRSVFGSESAYSGQRARAWPGAASHAASTEPNPTGLWWMKSRSQAPAGASDNSVPVTLQLPALEGQLRELATQIEMLRRHPGHSVNAKPHNIAEIVAPLLRALPHRDIETLESEARILGERIEAGRASGIDALVLAPIEAGLADVRAALQQLKPNESLAAFKAAIQNLAERLNQPVPAYQVGYPLAQIDTAIAAMRNIVALTVSKDALIALSDEVRGLSARFQRVIAQNANRPASQPPAAPSCDDPRLSSFIERSLKEINLRLDALQNVTKTPGNFSATGDRLHHDRSAQDEPQAAPPLMPDHASDDLERPRRSIALPMMFGALVLGLSVVAARVAMQMTEVSAPAVYQAAAAPAAESKERPSATERPAPEVPDLLRSQEPDHFSPVPSGILAPGRPNRPAPSAFAEFENNGAIGRPVTVAAGSRETAREPSLPLPETLPAALRSEALKGKPAAEFEVGVRLVEGKSVPVNTEEGLRWLRRAAKSGIIPAHLWIGSLYEKGLGVEKDLNLARTHYRAAAEKGNAKAMHNLAVLYAEGIDGRRDYATAARWFQRAAERGVADSQYNLAVLLMRGIGVDQNHQQSYKWFALAALQGDREAARRRDEIGSKLDPAALAAARSQVQSFAPQAQPEEATVVAAPPGGWDNPTDNAGRKQRSGIFARGAS